MAFQQPIWSKSNPVPHHNWSESTQNANAAPSLQRKESPTFWSPAGVSGTWVPSLLWSGYCQSLQLCSSPITLDFHSIFFFGKGISFISAIHPENLFDASRPRIIRTPSYEWLLCLFQPSCLVFKHCPGHSLCRAGEPSHQLPVEEAITHASFKKHPPSQHYQHSHRCRSKQSLKAYKAPAKMLIGLHNLDNRGTYLRSEIKLNE